MARLIRIAGTHGGDTGPGGQYRPGTPAHWELFGGGGLPPLISSGMGTGGDFDVPTTLGTLSELTAGSDFGPNSAQTAFGFDVPGVDMPTLGPLVPAFRSFGDFTPNILDVTATPASLALDLPVLTGPAPQGGFLAPTLPRGFGYGGSPLIDLAPQRGGSTAPVYPDNPGILDLNRRTPGPAPTFNWPGPQPGPGPLQPTNPPNYQWPGPQDVPIVDMDKPCPNCLELRGQKRDLERSIKLEIGQEERLKLDQQKKKITGIQERERGPAPTDVDTIDKQIQDKLALLDAINQEIADQGGDPVLTIPPPGQVPIVGPGPLQPGPGQPRSIPPSSPPGGGSPPRRITPPGGQHPITPVIPPQPEQPVTFCVTCENIGAALKYQSGQGSSDCYLTSANGVEME